MNKGRPLNYNEGDEISYAMPSGVLYGTVTRVIGQGDSSAVEIEFEGGRKEIKKTRDRALSSIAPRYGQERRRGAPL